MIPGTSMMQAPHQLAYGLLESGQAERALQVIEPWARLPDAPHAVLAAYASALKATGRPMEALEIHRTATKRFPNSGVAWHNLGASLANTGAYPDAIKAIERGFRAGLDAAASWQVWARAHQWLMNLEKAERGYREALKRDPGNIEAGRDLAQLVWMRSADVEAAAAVFATLPWSGEVAVHQARLFKGADDPARALQVLEDALPRAPGDSGLVVNAAQMAMEAGAWSRALVYAETGVQRRPGDFNALETLAVAHLALDQAAESLAVARQIHAMEPLNQAGIAVLASAARAAGGAEYEKLYNYEAFVRSSEIGIPKGWPTREAFLRDLKAALVRLHVMKTHPLDQSLRHGSQTTQDLRSSDEPAIRAFFEALQPLVQSYMDAVGDGDDPLRVRNSRAYGLAGAWSVRLRPHGYHVDHIHPQGWLSSAFYVETPAAAVEGPAHEGWIKFGTPGLPLREKPEPAHYVRPEPGRLVLFPSYMWHGTVPFTTDEHRMTLAFDIVPA